MELLEYKRNNNNGKNHPYIDQVKIFDGKPNFPISWLNTQGYCEYSLYLEHFKHVEVAPNKAMLTGTCVHNSLEKKFREEATTSTLSDIIATSNEKEVLSREFYVISERYGIRGFIDEIWITPSGVTIIDDKPGCKAYYSMMNQVYAYTLAYKEYTGDKRDVTVALRTRETGKIFWQQKYTSDTEKKIKETIKHIQRLILGMEKFIPTSNNNKCNSCRFNKLCDKY